MEFKEGCNIIDKNQSFIQNLNVDEVPWHRITAAYGRATEFPEYFKIMYDMKDMAAVKTALNEITSNIEHQSTLWSRHRRENRLNTQYL